MDSQKPTTSRAANSIATPQTVKLTIGPYQIKPIPTGLFGLDGGAMFGTVPKVLWEKSNPADEHNRIEMEARALLLDGGPGQRVLIDCGIGGDFIAKYGEKLGPKFAEMYSVDPANSVLRNSMAKNLSRLLRTRLTTFKKKIMKRRPARTCENAHLIIRQILNL
jgi:hypothetical protein